MPGYLSPLHKWHNTVPDYSHLRVLGSSAFVHIEKVGRTKLQLPAFKGILVGYGTQSRTYRVYNPGNRTVYETAQVTFIESPGPALTVTHTGGLKRPIGATLLPTTPITGVTVTSPAAQQGGDTAPATLRLESELAQGGVTSSTLAPTSAVITEQDNAVTDGVDLTYEQIHPSDYWPEQFSTDYGTSNADELGIIPSSNNNDEFTTTVLEPAAVTATTNSELLADGSAISNLYMAPNTSTDSSLTAPSSRTRSMTTKQRRVATNSVNVLSLADTAYAAMMFQAQAVAADPVTTSRHSTLLRHHSG